MKIINKIITAVVIVAFSFPALGNNKSDNTPSNDKTTNNEEVLKIKGDISNLSIDLTEAVIKLYDGNTLIETIKTNKAGKFQLNLLKDKQYMLEVCAENHLAKRIVLNTSVDEIIGKTPEFHPSLELISEKLVRGTDYSELDFPYAIVEYDETLEGFDFNKEYTAEMKKLEKEFIYEAYLITKRQMKAMKKRKSNNTRIQPEIVK